MSKKDKNNKSTDEQKAYLDSLKEKSIEELKIEAEKTKLINEIQGNNFDKNLDLYHKLKKMRRMSIISIVLWIIAIGILLSFVLEIIYGVEILTTNWKNKKLNITKCFFGVLCFLPLLGIIFSLIFATEGLKTFN